MTRPRWLVQRDALMTGVLLVAMTLGGWGSNLTAQAANLPAHEVVGPAVGSTTAATLTIGAGMDSLSLSTAAAHARLFRLGTRKTDGVVPTVTGHGSRFGVGLQHVNGAAGAHLRVTLAADVRWTIRMAGSASLEKFTLIPGSLAALTLADGVSKVDLVLPPPHGVINVTVQGGSSDFTVAVPSGVDATVDFAGGAGNATLEGLLHSGITAGTSYAVGNSGASNRYAFDFTAGIGTFAMSAT